MNNFFIKKYPALKNKQLVYLSLSQLCSLTGGYIQNVALSALITENSDGRLKLGLFLFVCYLPVFLLSYFTGKLTKRVSAVKVLYVTEIILLVLSVILAVFCNMPYYMLLVFGGVWGVIRAFQTPASSSMPKLLCEKNELKSGVAVLSFAMSFARALGPILSGVLYTAFGYRASFIANIISYLPSLLLLFKLKPKQADNISQSTKPRLSLPLLVMVFTLSLFGTAYNIIFTGLGAKLELSKLWFSVFMGLVGVGAALGALIMKKDKLFLYASLGISVSAALLSFLKTPVIICFVIVFYGLCDYLFFTSAMTYIQSENDASSVSRAMGAYTAVTTGALPLGFLGLGLLSDNFGITSVLVLSAVSIAFVYILFFGKIR